MGISDGLKALGALLGGERARGLLPLALLLAAMSSVFVFGDNRDTFYRAQESHSYISSQHLTIAANLSPRHNFLMHTERRLKPDGTVEYAPYNRFPMGGYALMKLAILPFGDNLSAQIYAARTLLLGLFIATGALAYLAVSRLVGSRWVALSATLLAFSTAYFLYYNDMTSNEIGIDLFGVMLTFHGMVVFAQEGRFRQLLFKACVALCLGWHVYALLLPFIAIGVSGELIGALRASSGLAALARARRILGALVRSRHMALGAAALGLGLAILAFNFGNEYLALGGEVEFAELPSVESMFSRTGIDDGLDSRFPDKLGWMIFLRGEFIKIGFMSVPFAFDKDSVFVDIFSEFPPYEYLAIGLAAAAACAVGLAFTRGKALALWGTLAAAGFCWALPMKRTAAFHDNEAVYYAGIPLFAFTLIMAWVGKRYGARVTRDLSVAALGVFVLSAFYMGQSEHTVGVERENELRAARVSDFESIREIAKGKTVFIARGAHNDWDGDWANRFYMHGRLFERGRPENADLIVTAVRQDADALLTPDNQTAFLYSSGFRSDTADWLAGKAEPIYRGEFDVYADGGRIYYIGAPYTSGGYTPKFFLHVVPADENDLSERYRERGFENLDFEIENHLLDPGAELRQIAMMELPSYPIASISTGQFTAEGRVWYAEAHYLGGGAWAAEAQAQADGGE